MRQLLARLAKPRPDLAFAQRYSYSPKERINQQKYIYDSN
jgi:hypothetical protein